MGKNDTREMCFLLDSFVPSASSERVAVTTDTFKMFRQIQENNLYEQHSWRCFY